MRHVKMLALLVLLVLLPAALAALPPHAQRLAELNAVLNHAGVIQAFDVTRPIDSVEYLDVDIYRVTGGGCHMLVHIVGQPLPPGFVGARQFDVVPGELHCG